MTTQNPSKPIRRLPLYALFAANVISVSVNVMALIPYRRAWVFGVTTAGVMLGTPLAGVSGLLVDRIGMTPTLVIMGVIYLAATASLLIVPAMREMDRPRPAEAAAEAVS